MINHPRAMLDSLLLYVQFRSMLSMQLHLIMVCLREISFSVDHSCLFSLVTRSPLPLGSLSALYETGLRSPGAIDSHEESANDDYGSTSYGPYQFFTKTQTIKNFLIWLRVNHQAKASELLKLTPGTKKFNLAWKKMGKEKVSSVFHSSG